MGVKDGSAGTRVKAKNKETSGADGSGSVVDRAVAHIRDKIMAGRFAPGQRLIEPELAQQVNVSRTALREAFRRLAAEGLVELTLYKGAMVRRVKKADVREAFLIREMLEGLVVRLATPVFAKPAQRRALIDIRDELQRTVTASDGGGAYQEANAKFHQLLIEAAQSPQLERLVGQLQLPLFRFIYSHLLSKPGRLGSMAQHQRIIDAILDGDAERAEAEMKAHIANTAECLLALPDDYFG